MHLKHSGRLIALLVLVLLIIACNAPSLTTRVEVTGGTIEGVEQDGIFSYKGIPFAAPPVGDLRWKSPQPVVPWQGVKKADAFAPGPMQDTGFIAQLGGKPNISEDCLYLNIWTGAKKANEKRSVMVWIYGGAFVGGMTSFPTFDGTNLAKKGVVLVSVAYRVGPMGFLAHPELSEEGGKGSGAYGIQDMIAGLRWVKDNIAQFGGDLQPLRFPPRKGTPWLPQHQVTQPHLACGFYRGSDALMLAEHFMDPIKGQRIDLRQGKTIDSYVPGLCHVACPATAITWREDGW